jgi:hypothetical protein
VTALETAARIAVDLLVREDFDTLIRMDQGGRVSAAALERTIADYGRTLVSPPHEWWSTVTITPVHRDGTPTLHAAVPLWTTEEGRSDLTLELEMTEIAPETYETALLDLHVL